MKRLQPLTKLELASLRAAALDPKSRKHPEALLASLRRVRDQNAGLIAKLEPDLAQAIQNIAQVEAILAEGIEA